MLLLQLLGLDLFGANMEKLVCKDNRKDLIAALVTMPDEAFAWFVLACPPSAMLKGGNAQIWPDGTGGFSKESRISIDIIRKAADAYFEKS